MYKRQITDLFGTGIIPAVGMSIMENRPSRVLIHAVVYVRVTCNLISIIYQVVTFVICLFIGLANHDLAPSVSI